MSTKKISTYRPRETRQVVLGGVKIGGGAPVSVQSMTKTDTKDGEATIRQIKALARAGCDIVRVAVPDRKALQQIESIVQNSPIPVVADIHFDHRLAIGAIKAGIHGIRINPGNISSEKALAALASAAGEAGIPIRVGANSGSIPAKFKEIISKAPDRHKAMAEALALSAIEQCAMLEKFGFHNIKVSIKASDVMLMVDACRRFAASSDYPMHLGVTEAGTLERGTVKSSVGIGTLLLEGIGDTVRVSLTASPLLEVKTAILILEAAGLRIPQPEIISCPTCGRTEFDLHALAVKVDSLVSALRDKGHRIPIRKIAVMGCVVNGPGEIEDAELGIAGIKGGKAAIFANNRKIGIYTAAKALSVMEKLLLEISRRNTPA